MDPRLVLEKLRNAGAKVAFDGKALRVQAPRTVLTPEVQREIAEHQRELLALVLYCDPSARLYPFLGKLVRTPDGEGRLWQVFATRVGVDLGGRIGFYSPEDIEPSREGGA